METNKWLTKETAILLEESGCIYYEKRGLNMAVEKSLGIIEGLPILRLKSGSVKVSKLSAYYLPEKKCIVVGDRYDLYERNEQLALLTCQAGHYVLGHNDGFRDIQQEKEADVYAAKLIGRKPIICFLVRSNTLEMKSREGKDPVLMGELKERVNHLLNRQDIPMQVNNTIWEKISS